MGIKKLLSVALHYRQRYRFYKQAFLDCIAGKSEVTYLEPPRAIGDIPVERVYERLRGVCPDAQIYLSDEIYTITTTDEIRRFLHRDSINRYRYVRTLFDCDDFSYALMGALSIPGWASLAFGIAWSGRHAFNIFIGHNRRVYVVEPQNDNIKDLANIRDERYIPRFIVM